MMNIFKFLQKLFKRSRIEKKIYKKKYDPKNLVYLKPENIIDGVWKPNFYPDNDVELKKRVNNFFSECTIIKSDYMITIWMYKESSKYKYKKLINFEDFVSFYFNYSFDDNISICIYCSDSKTKKIIKKVDLGNFYLFKNNLEIYIYNPNVILL